ncbi:ubiquitin-conjugating enzyme E2 28-like [Setaria italica]|uniref:UBC core domain-containing protein n=1 Tax=Setaria italica TaxID=4555 RepID=K3Z0H5_SETIT|nr:ubiquitin-conjugating enzyme E2 28-like [Setaria italica]XP_034594625.1 ubiquitin-conjugating enzyme E2 28-like [Setaria viridis]
MAPGGGALRRTTTTGGARPADKSRRWETRLERELEGLWADPPEWCLPGADATDRLRWQVVVVGPEGSPYDGGVFAVRLEFPRDYPFKAPKVFFATKVYHPNVDPRTGLVCLDFLTDKNWWTPAWSVDKVLLVVVSLLHEPVMDGVAINREAAYLYKKKRLVYEEIARAKTREHASASASSTDVSSSSSSDNKERLRRPSSRGVSQLCRRLTRRVKFLRTSE